jgi:hypothetical protein
MMIQRDAPLHVGQIALVAFDLVTEGPRLGGKSRPAVLVHRGGSGFWNVVPLTSVRPKSTRSNSVRAIPPSPLNGLNVVSYVAYRRGLQVSEWIIEDSLGDADSFVASAVLALCDHSIVDCGHFRRLVSPDTGDAA